MKNQENNISLKPFCKFFDINMTTVRHLVTLSLVFCLFVSLVHTAPRENQTAPAKKQYRKQDGRGDLVSINTIHVEELREVLSPRKALFLIRHGKSNSHQLYSFYRRIHRKRPLKRMVLIMRSIGTFKRPLLGKTGKNSRLASQQFQAKLSLAPLIIWERRSPRSRVRRHANELKFISEILKRTPRYSSTSHFQDKRFLNRVSMCRVIEKLIQLTDSKTHGSPNQKIQRNSMMHYYMSRCLPELERFEYYLYPWILSDGNKIFPGEKLRDDNIPPPSSNKQSKQYRHAQKDRYPHRFLKHLSSSGLSWPSRKLGEISLLQLILKEKLHERHTLKRHHLRRLLHQIKKLAKSMLEHHNKHPPAHLKRTVLKLIGFDQRDAFQATLFNVLTDIMKAESRQYFHSRRAFQRLRLKYKMNKQELKLLKQRLKVESNNNKKLISSLNYYLNRDARKINNSPILDYGNTDKHKQDSGLQILEMTITSTKYTNLFIESIRIIFKKVLRFIKSVYETISSMFHTYFSYFSKTSNVNKVSEYDVKATNLNGIVTKPQNSLVSTPRSPSNINPDLKGNVGLELKNIMLYTRNLMESDQFKRMFLNRKDTEEHETFVSKKGTGRQLLSYPSLVEAGDHIRFEVSPPRRYPQETNVNQSLRNILSQKQRAIYGDRRKIPYPYLETPSENRAIPEHILRNMVNNQHWYPKGSKDSYYHTVPRRMSQHRQLHVLGSYKKRIGKNLHHNGRKLSHLKKQDKVPEPHFMENGNQVATDSSSLSDDQMKRRFVNMIRLISKKRKSLVPFAKTSIPAKVNQNHKKATEKENTTKKAFLGSSSEDSNPSADELKSHFPYLFAQGRKIPHKKAIDPDHQLLEHLEMLTRRVLAADASFLNKDTDRQHAMDDTGNSEETFRTNSIPIEPHRVLRDIQGRSFRSTPQNNNNKLFYRENIASTSKADVNHKQFPRNARFLNSQASLKPRLPRHDRRYKRNVLEIEPTDDHVALQKFSLKWEQCRKKLSTLLDRIQHGKSRYESLQNEIRHIIPIGDNLAGRSAILHRHNFLVAHALEHANDHLRKFTARLSRLKARKKIVANEEIADDIAHEVEQTKTTLKDQKNIQDALEENELHDFHLKVPKNITSQVIADAHLDGGDAHLLQHHEVAEKRLFNEEHKAHAKVAKNTERINTLDSFESKEHADPDLAEVDGMLNKILDRSKRNSRKQKGKFQSKTQTTDLAEVDGMLNKILERSKRNPRKQEGNFHNKTQTIVPKKKRQIGYGYPGGQILSPPVMYGYGGGQMLMGGIPRIQPAPVFYMAPRPQVMVGHGGGDINHSIDSLLAGHGMISRHGLRDIEAEIDRINNNIAETTDHHLHRSIHPRPKRRAVADPSVVYHGSHGGSHDHYHPHTEYDLDSIDMQRGLSRLGFLSIQQRKALLDYKKALDRSFSKIGVAERQLQQQLDRAHEKARKDLQRQAHRKRKEQEELNHKLEMAERKQKEMEEQESRRAIKDLEKEMKKRTRLRLKQLKQRQKGLAKAIHETQRADVRKKKPSAALIHAHVQDEIVNHGGHDSHSSGSGGDFFGMDYFDGGGGAPDHIAVPHAIDDGTGYDGW